MYMEIKKPVGDWTINELRGLTKELEAKGIPTHFSLYWLREIQTTITLNIENLNDASCEIPLNEPMNIEKRVLELGDKTTEATQAMAIVTMKQVEMNKKKMLALPGEVIEQADE